MLDDDQRTKLTRFAQALINQKRAHVIMPPNQPRSGFWFGGGNMVEADDGTFYLTGRYRNAGDSRTGLGAGERGLELVIYRSMDRGRTFQRVLSFSKARLGLPGRPAQSIEGSALHLTAEGVELFVSSEKANIRYPQGLEAFQKPGTGVWTIERLRAESIEALADAVVKPLLECRDPRYIHVKDPLVHDRPNGDTILGFCTHPYNWSSSNSAYAVRHAGAESFGPPCYDFFPRGCTWDVAMTRVTCLLIVPRVGAFADEPPVLLAFYDGGECLRNHDEHTKAVKRPRGYSCEEIGGAAVALEEELARIERLSVNLPLFVSPWGTGCSRYVDVLRTEEGFYATWQQSQPDLSQPLVMNYLTWEDAEGILA